MTPIKLSPDGLDFLVGQEGVVLHHYLDSAGYDTIGVGHLLHPDELNSGFVVIGLGPVDWTRDITRSQAMQLLLQDVSWAVSDISRNVKVSMTQHQADALTSFVFNVGAPHFEASTLLKRLNAGQYDLVPPQMVRWTHAGGKVDPVLVKRRAAEIALWGMS